MEQTSTGGLPQESRPALIPQKERLWVLLAFGLAVLIAVTGLWNMLQMAPADLHKRSFEFVIKNYGSLAQIAVFMVLAHVVLRFILQKRLLDQWSLLKQGIAFLYKLARQWHTPIAVIAIGLIVLHATAAFLHGIKLDFHNISGLLALLVLLPIPVSGLLRYRKMDRKWHLRLGLSFAVLFLLHSYI